MSIFIESETYRPFKYPWAVEAAKEHAIDMHWDVHQVDLSDDLRQYKSKGGLETKNVSHEQNKDTVDSLLCLFTELDRVVGEGYTRLIPHTKNNEIRNLLITLAAREVVHQRAYALAAETFGFPDSAWLKFKDYVEMQDKLNLISEEVEDLHLPVNYAKQLAKILLGEGIGLFAAFTSFLNMKRHGKLIGFNDINQWSLSDEDFHVTKNIRLLKTIIEEDLTPDEIDEVHQYIIEVAEEYVQCEFKLIDLLGPQEGLPKQEQKNYISFLGRLRKQQLGLECIPGEGNLEWMEYLLSAKTHDNFFEKKITEYSHDPLKGEVDYTKYLRVLDQKLGE